MTHPAVEEIYLALSDDLQAVNRILAETAASRLEFITRALDRPLAQGGKRLRPLMVLLSARAVDESPPPATVEIAAAAEAIHIAALLLDDVIDNAQVRRGQDTLAKEWGHEVPVLLADYIFARTCARLAQNDFPRPLAALAATTTRMVEGELIEILNRHNFDLSEPQYLAIIEGKTATLFSACCQAGALVAGAGPALAETFARAGLNFGIAFQIVDDLLDFLGEEQLLGKRPGQDLACGRVTLPLIHALRCAPHEHRLRFEHLLRATQEPGARLAHALAFIKEYGGFDYARSLAQRYSEEAAAAFASLPASPARESLLTLTEYALRRPA